MAGVQHGQVDIPILVVSHVGQQANAQAQADVGFDDIGINGSQHDIGMQAFLLDHTADQRAAGESKIVGNQGVI